MTCATSVAAKTRFRSLLHTVRKTITGSLCRSTSGICAGCLRPASISFIWGLGGTRAVVSHYSGAPTARRPPSLARDCVSSANAGEHFPKRVEHAIRRCLDVFEIAVVDIRRKHLALSRGMFAVRFDVDTEVFVMFRIGEAVMLLQPVDLRFTNCGNLTFVR